MILSLSVTRFLFIFSLTCVSYYVVQTLDSVPLMLYNGT